MEDSLQTLPELVRFWGKERPDAEVFTFVTKDGRSGVYTPKDILKLSSRFAWILKDSYGFTQGDVISNALPNSQERLIVDVAIIMAGCIMVNCQVLERDGSDLWDTMRVAGSKGVILPVTPTSAPYCLLQPLLEPCAEGEHKDKEERHRLITLRTEKAPQLTKAILVNRETKTDGKFPLPQSFLESLRAMDDESDVHILESLPTPSPGDVAVLFATSGSSGFCKLVPRTHKEVLGAARSFKGAKDSRYYSDRSFGWMGGFPFDYFAFCAVRVLQDQLSNNLTSSARDVWRLIAREKCTGAAIVPIELEELIKEYEHKKSDYVIPALVTTGMPIRESLGKAIGLLTHALVVAYASTELGMISVSVVTQASQISDFLSGRPVPDVKVKVVDEQGRDVPTGSDGILLVKTPRVLQGYYNQPEETKKIFTSDGWVNTGDRGSLDADGNLYCLGRDGDALMQGSVVVYSSWPEGILARCPGVAQASVVVVQPPQEAQGNRVFCACVVPKPDSGLTVDKLFEFYKSSFFGQSQLGGAPPSSPTDTPPSSSTQVPVQGAKPKGYMIALEKILFVEKIPLTETGKINRRELVALALKSFSD